MAAGTGRHDRDAVAATRKASGTKEAAIQANDIDVWLGLDVGKETHHACALDSNGGRIHDRPLRQDEKEIRDLLSRLSQRGRVLVVVDQPNTIGSLPLAVARDMGLAVAYLPGGAMRKAAQLLPGDAKTDERDAYVIAFTALHMPMTLRDCGGATTRPSPV